jgi:hypothetical protein
MNMTAELTNWSWEQKCRKAVAALETNGFTSLFCATPHEAAEYILQHAEGAQSVGFGGSMTIAGLGVESVLTAAGKEILNHGNPALSPEEKQIILRRELTCDLFLCSTNALTLRGELVNIDGVGNRVGAMLFGPRAVIVVAGRNKLVDGSPQDAIQRVKTWAAPPNSKRLNAKTPCASTGFCSNCNSPERICRVTTIIDRKPRLTDLHVLVVNADLGF